MNWESLFLKEYNFISEGKKEQTRNDTYAKTEYIESMEMRSVIRILIQKCSGSGKIPKLYKENNFWAFSLVSKCDLMALLLVSTHPQRASKKKSEPELAKFYVEEIELEGPHFCIFSFFNFLFGDYWMKPFITWKASPSSDSSMCFLRPG